MRKLNWSNIRYAIDGKEATFAWVVFCCILGLLFIAGVLGVAPVLTAAAWPFAVAGLVVAQRIWKEYRRVR